MKLRSKKISASATEKDQESFQPANALSIFQRIAEKDRNVVRDCINTYGNFIWALARKFTASREEAEAATLEIFNDIWRYAERDNDLPSSEKVLIALIARRRLVRYLQQ